MKDKLPLFEDFTPLGVGMKSNRRSTKTGQSINTGYNMKVVAGPIQEITEQCANEALNYEYDEYDEHKGKEFLAEAENVFSKHLRESYNKKNKPTKKLIQKHINQYTIADEPYDVAKEIGSEYDWNEKEIEKAEGIIAKNFIK